MRPVISTRPLVMFDSQIYWYSASGNHAFLVNLYILITVGAYTLPDKPYQIVSCIYECSRTRLF